MIAMNFKMLNSLRFGNIYNWSVHYANYIEKNYSEKFKLVKIGDFLKRSKKPIEIKDRVIYKRVKIRINGGGISVRDEILGDEIGTKSQFLVKTNQFLLSKIDARNGAFGVVPDECDGAVITGNFWTFDVDYQQINPHFLKSFTSTKHFQEVCQRASNGTTNRNYLQEGLFLEMEIPLPDVDTQNQLVEQYNENLVKAQNAQLQADELEKEMEKYLFEALGIEVPEKKETKLGLQMVRFNKILQWSVDRVLYGEPIVYKKDEPTILNYENLVSKAFRGKSPKYDDNGEALILNQKCNRWNEIKLEFSKRVDKKWVDSIDSKFKTIENDILINSTGEGTIGRCSLVTKEHENLIYDSHILLLRLNENYVDATFFMYQFNSVFVQEQINQLKTAQSTKQTELGLDNLFKINFVIPKRIYKSKGEIDETKDIQIQIINHIKQSKEKIKNLREQSEKLKKEAKEDFEKEIFA